MQQSGQKRTETQAHPRDAHSADCKVVRNASTRFPPITHTHTHTHTLRNLDQGTKGASPSRPRAPQLAQRCVRATRSLSVSHATERHAAAESRASEISSENLGGWFKEVVTSPAPRSCDCGRNQKQRGAGGEVGHRGTISYIFKRGKSFNGTYLGSGVK